MEPFFIDRQLLVIIDQVARRYNKTPYEIASGTTIEEFDFNVAVMFIAQIEANKEAERVKQEAGQKPDGKSSGPKGGWGAFGINRKIVMKGKE